MKGISMQKKIWPILLIALGLYMLYLSLAAAMSMSLFLIFLAIAGGFLGSGIILFIADKKYPLLARTAGGSCIEAT